MKEFDFNLDIFGGLDPRRSSRKEKTHLLVCHNLEPVDDDYELHQFVIDLDTDDYPWVPAIPNVQFSDIWQDLDPDVWLYYGSSWTSHRGSVFEDDGESAFDGDQNWQDH